MDPTDAVLQVLRRSRIALEPGLSDREFLEIESRCRFRFPPDLRAVLAAALPIDLGFPNWRTGEVRWRIYDGSVRTRTIDPADAADVLDGILFDVEHNSFWPTSWGPRPPTLNKRKAEVARRVMAAPPLIPVYSHRCIPSEPHEAGNPVLSVSQTDIIYYGRDLLDYVRNEFDRPRPECAESQEFRRVPFWTDFVADCWAATDDPDTRR